MKPVRELLLDAGISEKDLEHAVKQSRNVAEKVMLTSTGAQAFLDYLAKHPKLPNKLGPWVVSTAKLAGIVKEGASELLRTKPK